MGSARNVSLLIANFDGSLKTNTGTPAEPRHWGQNNEDLGTGEFAGVLGSNVLTKLTDIAKELSDGARQGIRALTYCIYSKNSCGIVQSKPFPAVGCM